MSVDPESGIDVDRSLVLFAVLKNPVGINIAFDYFRNNYEKIKERFVL